LSNVSIRYNIEGTTNWYSVPMHNYFKDIFYGQIPKLPDNTKLTYYLTATSVNGYTQSSLNYTYTVKDITPPSIYNIQQSPEFPDYK